MFFSLEEITENTVNDTDSARVAEFNGMKITGKPTTKFGQSLNRLPFGLGAPPEGKVGLDWGLSGVPETYAIDGNGIVRLHFRGPLTERPPSARRPRPALPRPGIATRGR